MPWFDMGCLQNPHEWVSLGWKEKIAALVQSNVMFVSLLFLAIEGACFCTFIFLLIQTSVLYGIRTAQAIAYTVLCGICHQSEKVIQRSQRFTNENEMLERGKNSALSQEAGFEANSFLHHV